MAEGSKGKRILDYALGMLAESGWILAVTLLALLMAVAAKVLWP